MKNYMMDAFLKEMFDLTEYHKQNCIEYKNIVTNIGFKNNPTNLSEIPYIPARLFKLLNLKSIPDNRVHKVLNSSGTSDNGKTSIFLDKENSFNQIKALSRIVGSRIGPQKKPLLILDSFTEMGSSGVSARKVGILGFSFFGKDVHYVLDKNMELNLQTLKNFLEKYKHEEILLYGFTYIIWQFVVNPLLNKGEFFDLSNATLIHGGGWKKVENTVGREEFNKLLRLKFKLKNSYNYYGMVEQTGSIFLECNKGYFHSNEFAKIIVRKVFDFSVAGNGEEGLIQVLSTLPRSYPGHSILTEDVGIIHGVDSCACGSPGEFFEVKGRLQNAEIRGCSDTFEYS